MFRVDLRRAGRGQQGVGEFFTAVGFREPPCGGIDQRQALHRGQLRLPLAQDCHGGQALPVRDHARAARGPQDRFVALVSTAAASSDVRDRSSSFRCGQFEGWKIRDTEDHSCSTRATDRARQGASRSTTLGDSWRLRCLQARTRNTATEPWRSIDPAQQGAAADGAGLSCCCGVDGDVSYYVVKAQRQVPSQVLNIFLCRTVQRNRRSTGNYDKRVRPRYIFPDRKPSGWSTESWRWVGIHVGDRHPKGTRLNGSSTASPRGTVDSAITYD